LCFLVAVFCCSVCAWGSGLMLMWFCVEC
jgi:hypothetical protein